MADLADYMPPLNISKEELKKWGKLWLGDFNHCHLKTRIVPWRSLLSFSAVTT